MAYNGKWEKHNNLNGGGGGGINSEFICSHYHLAVLTRKYIICTLKPIKQINFLARFLVFLIILSSLKIF